MGPCFERRLRHNADESLRGAEQNVGDQVIGRISTAALMRPDKQTTASKIEHTIHVNTLATFFCRAFSAHLEHGC